MVPRGYFMHFSPLGRRPFSFLESIPFSEAFSFIKGLSLCEVTRTTHFVGSCSLINPAFFVMMHRPTQDWAEVAIWVIKHNDNPYVPFIYSAERRYWEAAMRRRRSVLGIYEFVCEQRRRDDINATNQAARRLITGLIQRLPRESPPPSEEIRQRIIERLEKDAGWIEDGHY